MNCHAVFFHYSLSPHYPKGKTFIAEVAVVKLVPYPVLILVDLQYEQA